MANKRFKIGQKVRWVSQAGGVTTAKTGIIIASCAPGDFDVNQRTKINILREAKPGTTVREAKEESYYTSTYTILKDKYRVKFDRHTARNRDEEHYLVEVQADGGKPYLYHPRTQDLTPAS
jgi:hypothetical protein